MPVWIRYNAIKFKFQFNRVYLQCIFFFFFVWKYLTLTKARPLFLNFCIHLFIVKVVEKHKKKKYENGVKETRRQHLICRHSFYCIRLSIVRRIVFVAERKIATTTSYNNKHKKSSIRWTIANIIGKMKTQAIQVDLGGNPAINSSN